MMTMMTHAVCSVGATARSHLKPATHQLDVSFAARAQGGLVSTATDKTFGVILVP